MRRATLNFVVDSIGLVALLLLVATGSVMKWVLPPGSGGGGHGYGFRGGRSSGSDADHVQQLLGLGRHDWGDIHFLLALLFVLLILVHLVLHWTWIKTCSRSILFPSHRVSCDPADEPDVQ